MTRINLLFVLGIQAATVGCAGGADDDRANTKSLPPEMNINGMRYVPLRENHPDEFVVKKPAAGVADGDGKPFDIDLAALSYDELARVMTGITEFDGFIYRVEPEPESIRAIVERMRDAGAAPGAGQNPVGEPADTLHPRYIIDDGRNRTLRRDNTSYPMSTVVQLDNGIIGCTGVLIGPSTLLTASHCLWDGQNFRPIFTFRPGVDIEDANPIPFQEWGCHGIWVAGGGASDVGNDYAVVDFRTDAYNCNDHPGNATGWMGTRVRSNQQLLAATVYLHGYPGDQAAYPQIWGMSGRISQADTNVIYYNMDEVDGDSGAPVYLYEGGLPYVVGINSGGSFDFGLIRNRGARHTATMWSQIMFWSHDY